METSLKPSRNSILYIAVLMFLVLLLNLFNFGLIPVDSKILLLTIIALLMWISIGIAVFARWLVKIFKSY